MSLIGGTLGIPTRILLGSERGQLASSSDERNFSSRVKERQQSYAEPTMIRAFTNRLKSVGVPIEIIKSAGLMFPPLLIRKSQMLRLGLPKLLEAYPPKTQKIKLWPRKILEKGSSTTDV